MGRDGGIKLERIAQAAPGDLDPPLQRVIMAAGPNKGRAIDRAGPDRESLESAAAGRRLDPEHAVYEPGSGIEVRAVEKRVVAVPGLPEGSFTPLEEVAPARVVRLAHHRIKQVVAMRLDQGLEQQGAAGDARVDV